MADQSAKRAFFFVFLAFSLLATLIGGIEPAGAHHDRPYHIESDMVNDGHAGNRSTFVLDPGQGNFVSRGLLLANQGLYNHFGFTDNFLWYAPENQRVVGENEQWSSCVAGTHSGGACPIGSVLTGPTHTIGSTFGAPTSLHLFEFGGAFIASACGNFSPAGIQPVPKIEGVKFRDADRDGFRDPGEALLPGWQINVTRISSAVGQATGPVATLSTDGGGHYSFPLQDHGPGVYRVSEVVPAGWQAYTAASYDVAVGFGIGTPTFTVDFGNAETTTDVAKTSFTLVDAPARLEKDQPASFTIHSEVTNHGPAGPIEVDEELTVVSQPEDCTIEGVPPRRRRTLDVGATAVFDDVVTVTCSRRSDHQFVFGNNATVASPLEVIDVDPTNNTATIDVTIPVFEQTVLALDQLSLTCDEYWAGDTFTCTASARVTNTGSAEDAQLLAALQLDGSATCSTVPARLQEHAVVLDSGTSETVSSSWSVSCPETTLHTFALAASVAVDEPHLEAEPKTGTIVWVPLDIKPNSDPNSLNIGRPGVVAVALLSTPDLDTTTAVVRSSLRFGPTGTEAAVVQCGSPEDANGDGLLDLVCRFRLADAGFAIGDTLGIVTGTLTDGRPFRSADRVRII